MGNDVDGILLLYWSEEFFLQTASNVPFKSANVIPLSTTNPST